ncbi:MAG: DUF3040 domain-containing protein [Streptosporangiaceae bacterium]
MTRQSRLGGADAGKAPPMSDLPATARPRRPGRPEVREAVVFPVCEQRILRQIADGLHADDRGFCRRFALRAAVLAWAGPAHRSCLGAVTVGTVLLVCAALAATAAVRPAAIAAVRALGSAARHSAVRRTRPE